MIDGSLRRYGHKMATLPFPSLIDRECYHHSTSTQGTILKIGQLIILLATLLVSSTSWAGDQYTCRGKVSGPEGTMRGQVTLSTSALSVEKRFLWVRDSAAYDFKSLQSVRVRRGLLFTRVRLRTGEDSAVVQIRTWAWNYEPVHQLLKEKL